MKNITEGVFLTGYGMPTFAALYGNPKFRLPSQSQASTWEGSDSDWMTVCNFLRGLRWHLQADSVTSLCEVTALFHQLGYKLVDLGSEPTYLDYHKKIRRAIVLLSRCDAVQVTRGSCRLHWRKLLAIPCPRDQLLGPLCTLITMPWSIWLGSLNMALDERWHHGTSRFFRSRFTLQEVFLGELFCT